MIVVEVEVEVILVALEPDLVLGIDWRSRSSMGCGMESAITEGRWLMSNFGSKPRHSSKNGMQTYRAITPLVTL